MKGVEGEGDEGDFGIWAAEGAIGGICLVSVPLNYEFFGVRVHRIGDRKRR